MEEVKSVQQMHDLFFDINNNFKGTGEKKNKFFSTYMQYRIFDECYREQLVSFFQMWPLIADSVPIEEADYILYASPYARVEDFSDTVLEDIEELAQNRKENAEIIVVGKAANIEKEIAGKYPNMTYVMSHFAEYLGKRFGYDISEKYFVYDNGFLNIWPVDGCLNKCGFCRRTYMEIPFESKSLEFLKSNLDYYQQNEPEKMKNISLRAENLTEYGIDLYGKRSLADVIRLLDSYEEIESIEIPIGMCIGEIDDDLLDALCSCKKIYSMALNLEAGTDRLLNVIGKRHSCERAKEICRKLKDSHQLMHLQTTVMLGLPTENFDDIFSLAQLILDCEFNYVHCNYYGYSPKHPLAKYEQLKPQVTEYHLQTLINYLKENFISTDRTPFMTMRHEKILDKNKKKDMKELRKIHEDQQYTLPRLLIIECENYFGDGVSIKTKRENDIYQMLDERKVLPELARIKKQQLETKRLIKK